MKANKSFGKHGGVNTPFHQVHIAMSGEIVNELNSPICSFEIDDIPAATRKANADIVMRCLNSHDALLNNLQRLVDIICGAERDVCLEDCDEAKAAIAKAKPAKRGECGECGDDLAAGSADPLCFTCRELENNRRYRQHNKLGEYAD